MNNIPHDNGLPLIGHALTAIKDPLGFLSQMTDTYRDVVRISIAGKKYYLILNPAICRHILQENVQNYYKPGLAKELKRFLGEGLATSNGEHWLRQRRLIQPAFHRKRIEQLVEVINEETSELIKNWKAEGLPHTKDVNQHFLNLTLANITRAMFGAELNSNLHEVAEIVNRLLEYSTKRALSIVRIPHYMPTLANIRFRKANEAFEKVIYGMIEQRKKKQSDKPEDGYKDVLDILLNAYDDASNSYMTDQQLRDEITTIFMAGHETTAQTLSWVFYLLAANPAVAERVKAEVDTFAGEEISFETLQKLEYTKAVIEETLRIYPPVWVIVRKAQAADRINATMSIPAGAIVLLNIYGMHHNKAFFDDPETFQPENLSADKKAQIPPFAYLPFGGGPRICIGNHFAMMVMQTVVCRLVREFEFKIPEGFKAQVVPGVTLRAKGGIRLRVAERV